MYRDETFLHKRNYKTSYLQDTHTIVYFAILLGQIACGFALGISGSALDQAQSRIALSDLWTGLIGAGSLIGLMGSFFMGWLSDRVGRRKLLLANMYVMAALSLCHLFVTDLLGIFLLRVGIGLMLAIDYTVGNTWLIEWLPEKYGPGMQSRLLLYWMVGFISAYVVGLIAIALPQFTWQMTFASSAFFALVTAFFRTMARIPASPAWLSSQGEHRRAQKEVEKRLGNGWRIPLKALRVDVSENVPVTVSFSSKYWKRTLTGTLFYACQAFAFFGISIFLPSLLKKLHMTDVVMSGLIYNGAMLVGVFLGMIAFIRLGRRTFLIGTFFLAAAALAMMAFVTSMPLVRLGFFAVFAVALSMQLILDYPYTSELFDIEVRGAGVGLCVTISRIGAALGTFLFPLIVSAGGMGVTVLVCAAILSLGGMVCLLFAPETSPRYKKAVV